MYYKLISILTIFLVLAQGYDRQAFSQQMSQQLKKLKHADRIVNRVMQQTTTDEWQPLRIVFQPLQAYSDSSLVQINKLIDICQQFFSTTYLVRRSPKPLVFTDYDYTSCGDYKVSKNISSTAFDADLVIFLLLEYQTDGTLAYSDACISDPISGRPIFSILSFSQVVSNTTDPGVIQFEKNIETTIHEMTHSIGFTNEYFPYFFDSNTNLLYQKSNYNQSGVVYLSTPRIVNYTRHYFGCQSAQGLAMEDQGGDGTYGSHWERRLFYNEIMTGSDRTGDFIFSVFTLMLLQDSGWYRIGNIVPDPMSFGHLKGCGFLNVGCKAGSYPEFCDETDQNQYCSFTYTGLGQCNVDALANKCAFISIFSNLDCRNILDVNSDPRIVAQFVDNKMDFQYNSKCFNGSFSKNLSDNFQQSCHVFSCGQNTNSESLSITLDSTQYQCNSNGQMLSNSSLQGQIQCPTSMNQFCYDYSECPNQCNEKGFCIAKICHCKKGWVGQGCEIQCSNYNYLNTCVVTCPALTFANVNTMTCLGCPFGCNLCISIGSCTQCNTGYYLLNSFCERDFTVILPEDIRQDTGQTSADTIYNTALQKQTSTQGIIFTTVQIISIIVIIS